MILKCVWGNSKLRKEYLTNSLALTVLQAAIEGSVRLLTHYALPCGMFFRFLSNFVGIVGCH